MRKDWIACLVYCAVMITPVVGFWAIFLLFVICSPLLFLVANPIAALAGNEQLGMPILFGLMFLAGPVRAITWVALRTPADRRIRRTLETTAIWTLNTLATLLAFVMGQIASSS